MRVWGLGRGALSGNSGRAVLGLSGLGGLLMSAGNQVPNRKGSLLTSTQLLTLHKGCSWKDPWEPHLP